MATRTSTFPRTPSPTTGRGPTRRATSTSIPLAVLQSGPAYHRHANPPVSTAVAAPSTTPPGSRPTSPSRPATSTGPSPVVLQCAPACNQQTNTPVPITAAATSATPSGSRPTSLSRLTISTNLSAVVTQSLPASTQQANTPVPTTTTTTPTTPSSSRPTSPSTTSASQAGTPPMSPVTSPPHSTSASSNEVSPTAWSRFKSEAKEVAVWVAIAFTIASFVRDYLDFTKDSGPSAQEIWQLQMRFRSSCEEDRRRGQRSDACDLELSKPASPPPGLSKRAEPGEGVRPTFELMNEWYLTLFILTMLMFMSAIRKRINKRCDGKPKPDLAKQVSTHSAKRTLSSMFGRSRTQRHRSSGPRLPLVQRVFRPSDRESDNKFLCMCAIAIPAYYFFGDYLEVSEDVARFFAFALFVSQLVLLLLVPWTFILDTLYMSIVSAMVATLYVPVPGIFHATQ